MSEEINRIITEHVRAQIRAVDLTAWSHWDATSHEIALTMVPAGWICRECEASFALREARW